MIRLGKEINHSISQSILIAITIVAERDSDDEKQHIMDNTVGILNNMEISRKDASSTLLYGYIAFAETCF